MSDSSIISLDQVFGNVVRQKRKQNGVKFKLAFNTIQKETGENPLEFALSNDSDDKQHLLEYIGHDIGPNDNHRWPKLMANDIVLQFVNTRKQRNDFLFIGAYKVLPKKRESERLLGLTYYDMKKTDYFANLVERLIVTYTAGSGPGRRGDYSKWATKAKVAQILRTPFYQIPFTGLNNVRLGFRQLRTIIEASPKKWKIPLNSIAGVYVITDLNTGKQYIGSAYGKEGIWQRWSEYTKTYTGNDKELNEIYRKLKRDYIRDNFQYSLLEALPITTSNNEAINRESYWKLVFDTRNHGYNLN